MARFQRVAAIGEVMIELIAGPGNSAELNVAGDSYNTAVYLARTAAGLTVDYITVLGEDRFSERILDHMAENDVGRDAVARHPTRMPGLYAIETDATGERSFAYWRSASAARTLFGEDARAPETVLSGYDLVLLTGISIAILPPPQRERLFSGLDGFRRAGGLVAFDSNYRAHLWNDATLARRETQAMWQRTDIALPSVDDEMALFGDTDEAGVLARLASCGVTRGALKRGRAGPMDLGPGHACPKVAEARTVVDTTAAGDSFNAGYLAGLAEGLPPDAAMRRGHDLACQVIGKRGAIVDLD